MANLLRDTIRVPQMWRMALELHEASLEVLFNPLLPQEEPLHYVFDIPQSSAWLEAVEEIVYENPLLLCDFNQVDIIFDTNRFTILPQAMATDETMTDTVHALWPDMDCAVAARPLQGTPETLVMAVDAGALAFVRRTFIEGRLTHPVGKLVEHFGTVSRSNRGRVYAYVREGVTYVVAFRDSTLCIACQYATSAAEDAAYYIMAAARQQHFDLTADDVMVAGTPALRDETISLLQSMDVNAMPALLPHSALTASYPIELTL